MRTTQSKLRISGAVFALFSLMVAFMPHAAASHNVKYVAVVDPPATPGKPSREKIAEGFGKVPLRFEENQGQTDPSVRFLARNSRYTVFLTDTEAVFNLRKVGKDNQVRHEVMRMGLVGANPRPAVSGNEEQSGQSNYLIGGDPSKWNRSVSAFGRVQYEDVYPGIDLVYYGIQRELEYDFIVAPGADANQIKLTYNGARNISLDRKGDLHLRVGTSDLVQPAPVIYQEINGQRRPVAGSFVIQNKHQVGFALGEYDHSHTLVIDPKLLFATYVGGNTEFIDIVEGKGDSALGIAVDGSGNVYLTGNTDSSDFPATSGAWNEELELRGDDACLIGGPLPCGDAYVLKLNTTGTQIVYATYIGGHNSDEGRAIAVDGTGRAYITGGTDPFNAANFCINPYLWPTTLNPYQNKPCYGARGDSDAFFAVLNSTGSDLVYSTYYGGGGDFDKGDAITVDASGNAYVVGHTDSNNLGIKNGFQEDRGSDNSALDGWVAKFNPAETGNDSLLYSSYLGGVGEDVARGVAVDNAGNAYVVGDTTSTNLAVKSPAGQALPPLESVYNGGASDGFIAKVDTTNAVGATSLVYLSYYGGIGRDIVNAVAVEPATQRAHFTGRSDNASGFPLLNQFDASAAGTDAFVAKVNADGTAQFYSTFLGGSGFDEGRGIALDAGNNVYVTGMTLSSAFPRVNAFQNTLASADGDAFVTKISAVATASQPKLLYSSLLGGVASGGGGTGRDEANGIAVDTKGNVYIAGNTASNAFPTTAGVVKPSSPGVLQTNLDAFVAKIEPTFSDTIGVFHPSTAQFQLRNTNTSGPANTNVTFGQAGDLAVVGDWNGDRIQDVGVFRPATGQFIIKKISFTIVCNPICLPQQISTTLTINFGLNGDLPVAGDWDNDGIDSVGVFRPSAGIFFLTDDNVANPGIDHQLNFGIAGDLPVAGDWNADGKATIGVFRPSAATFFLTNQDVANPGVDITTAFGVAEDLPVAGDFDGDSKDTIGVWRPSVGTFFLSNNNATVDITALFGTGGDQPVVGDWDGKP